MSLNVLESKECCTGFPFHCTYSFFIKLGKKRRLTLRVQPIKSIPVETNYVVSANKLQRRAKFYSYNFCTNFSCHMA